MRRKGFYVLAPVAMLGAPEVKRYFLFFQKFCVMIGITKRKAQYA